MPYLDEAAPPEMVIWTIPSRNVFVHGIRSVASNTSMVAVALTTLHKRGMRCKEHRNQSFPFGLGLVLRRLPRSWTSTRLRANEKGGDGGSFHAWNVGRILHSKKPYLSIANLFPLNTSTLQSTTDLNSATCSLWAMRYARSIQSMMAPTTEQLNALFPKCMVYDRPMDRLSGDFLFVAERGPMSYPRMRLHRPWHERRFNDGGWRGKNCGRPSRRPDRRTC